MVCRASACTDALYCHRMTQLVWTIVGGALAGLAAAAVLHLIIEKADGRLYHF
ncbi:hypothetical protein MPUL_00410 [Mycolicibacterium pulveris]|uniref:Uncharacterized protein n=1 Tax=Mycolicibacterium pulveris TaxID=36813 RepID=A0A7I7UD86_MYCPV|nr:hypothetical protein MPUL_00410 [Mycolicibacterium pulveris]